MATRVKFYDQSGHEISSRQFQPMQRVDINVYVTGALGTGEPFATVTCDVLNGSRNIFSSQATTSLFGVADFQMQFPANVSGYGNVHINVSLPISGGDSADVPIAFGNNNPSPLPNPSADWLSKITSNVVILAAIGLGVYLFVRKKLF